YTYDADDRLVGEAITDPVNGDRTVQYTYDAVGNRLTRDDSLEGVTSDTYDANDHLVSETLIGVVTTYSYDGNGNLVSRGSGPAAEVVYHWDCENRLVGADITDATGTHRASYRYDASGNRIAQVVDGVETRFLVDTNRPFAEVLEECTPAGAVSVSYVY